MITHDTLRRILNSNGAHVTLYVLGGLLFTTAVFQAGMEVGFRKATFSYRGADNYERVFGQRGGMMFVREKGFSAPGDFQGAHGAAGRLLSIQLPLLVIAGPDGTEKIVRVTDDTEIRRFRETIPAEELKTDDIIAVLGAPNEESQIEARLIRILPPAPDAQTGSLQKPGR